MPSMSSVTNIWNNVKEVDLRPLRNEATRLVKIAIVGAPGAGQEQLADQLRHDPSRPGTETQTPLLVASLEDAVRVDDADLLILVVDATRQEFHREKELARTWLDEGKKWLVFINQPADTRQVSPHGAWTDWGTKHLIYGPAGDGAFLQLELAPVVLEMLLDHHLSLARHFPLFRMPVAVKLINDTSFSNATYSLSTGLAEIVPVIDIPLNVADMVVLTKAQAFLVYKLGLALGLSTEWRDYITEFGSVLGGGFVWRQVARSLVGLIPGWGIVPKVAVAYSGTYVVGNVVLQWYLTGRHLNRQQISNMYRQALLRGRDVARQLVSRAPKPRIRIGRRKPEALPAPESPASLPDGLSASSGNTQPENPFKVCANCGRSNAPDAVFCQYCGKPL